METALRVPIIIIGVAVITFAIRFLPLIGFASFKLPRLIDIWLQNIIIAILAAMVFQNLFLIQGHLLLSWDFRFLGASVAIITALLTRNLLLTVITGTAVVCIATILG